MTRKKINESLKAPGEGDAAWPEQLAVRIAWCYYGLGMTQQEVASRLGLNRIRVNRLLNEARRRGLVRISIESKLAENVELEHELRERFGLDHAEVVLAMSGEERTLASVLGAGACALVTRLAQNGMAIGIGWGISLRGLAEAMPMLPLKNVSVISMLGSLTQRSSVSAYEAATTLAARFQAECFYLAGPVLCDSRRSRDTLMAQPMLNDVMNRARKADLAFVSVGGLDSGTIWLMRLVNKRDIAEVRRAGGIGNFLGYYINDKAQVIDHPINDRVIGLRPEELPQIPERIMISGGKPKVRVLAALLQNGLLTGIVTDQETARALLKDPQKEKTK